MTGSADTLQRAEGRPRCPIESDLLPLVRRLARVDDTTLVRLRALNGVQGAFAVLPSQVLVGRTVASRHNTGCDVTVQAGPLLRALDADVEPTRHDHAWRAALPSGEGWTVLDRVPESVVRELLGEGRKAHEQAAQQALGQRAAQDLLDLAVLTVQDNRACAALSPGTGRVAERVASVTNRMLSAVVAMGFLPSAGHVTVAVNGRWTRVAAQYGSVFREDPRAGLAMMPARRTPR